MLGMAPVSLSATGSARQSPCVDCRARGHHLDVTPLLEVPEPVGSPSPRLGSYVAVLLRARSGLPEQHRLHRLVRAPRHCGRGDVEQHARLDARPQRRLTLLRQNGPQRLHRGGGIHHAALHPLRLQPRLDDIQRVGERRGDAPRRAARHRLHQQPLCFVVAAREHLLPRLVYRKVDRHKRHVHQQRGLVRLEKRAQAVSAQSAPRAVHDAAVGRARHLQPLLDDVPRRHAKVVHGGGHRARNCRLERPMSLLVGAQELPAHFVSGKVQRVRGAGTQRHRRHAIVQPRDALAFQDHLHRPP
mmetsp:Transcript_29493/g.74149  ORF Transcript_29493/g.74149 Transcript_29493/m.74149 type:complete len:301 (+) Transcript_29493:71-973(+)